VLDFTLELVEEGRDSLEHFFAQLLLERDVDQDAAVGHACEVWLQSHDVFEEELLQTSSTYLPQQFERACQCVATVLAVVVPERVDVFTVTPCLFLILVVR